CLQRVESKISVEAAVSAAILQYTQATRLPLQQCVQAARLPLRLVTLDRLPRSRPDMANSQRNSPIQLEPDSPLRNSIFPRNFRCSGVRDQRIQVARVAASPRP